MIAQQIRDLLDRREALAAELIEIDGEIFEVQQLYCSGACYRNPDRPNRKDKHKPHRPRVYEPDAHVMAAPPPSEPPLRAKDYPPKPAAAVPLAERRCQNKRCLKKFMPGLAESGAVLRLRDEARARA